MSVNSTQSVTCPSCGQLHETVVWNSITVHDSPDLKKELLQGKINFFTCPDCGYRALMPSPLMYDDRDKKLMISFTPSNDKQTTARIFEQIKEKTKNPDTFKYLEGCALRFVSDFNCLLEKILIYDNNLWDKTIEILKLLILSQEPEKQDSRTCMFGKLENDELEFMVKDSKENQVYISKVPKKSYDDITKELRLSGVKPYSFNWEIVDADYAAALLNGINNI